MGTLATEVTIRLTLSFKAKLQRIAKIVYTPMCPKSNIAETPSPFWIGTIESTDIARSQRVARIARRFIATKS